VQCVALLAHEPSGGWILASASFDRTTRVARADQVARPEWQRLRSPLGDIATRHERYVQCVALLAHEPSGGWVLASGSRDRTTRVARAHEVSGPDRKETFNDPLLRHDVLPNQSVLLKMPGSTCVTRAHEVSGPDRKETFNDPLLRHDVLPNQSVLLKMPGSTGVWLATVGADVRLHRIDQPDPGGAPIIAQALPTPADAMTLLDDGPHLLIARIIENEVRVEEFEVRNLS